MRNSQPKGLKGMEIFLNTTCFHETPKIKSATASTVSPYICHLMLRVDSLEKTLMLGGIGLRKIRYHLPIPEASTRLPPGGSAGKESALMQETWV